MTQTPKKEKLNKIEQAKANKHPLLLKQELEHFASIGWEAMDEFERNQGSSGWVSIAQSLLACL